MDNASNVDNTFGAGHLTVAPCVSVNLIALRKINKEISIYSSIFDINLDWFFLLSIINPTLLCYRVIFII